MRCCCDKPAWIGLGVPPAGLLVADPKAGWVVLPVLAGLACLVQVPLLMRGMRHHGGSASAAPSGEPAVRDRAAAGAPGPARRADSAVIRTFGTGR